MKCFLKSLVLLVCHWSLVICHSLHAVAADKNVPLIAEAEIARRGALVERVNGIQAESDSASAIALAMQPPPDDSHKWLFTLVTTKNCSWCEQMRRDFATDPKLKSWVDTKDYIRSWAHWQIVQIEDQSQAWRWKDFKPTSFPTLIVQPPVNGSWGDPHTIVFVRQNYLKPAQLDTAIREAIQLYSTKLYSRRLAWSKTPSADQSATIIGGIKAEPRDEHAGGWNPPVSPPAPLPPLPAVPSTPNQPAQYPPAQYPPSLPNFASLLAQLLGSLLGGPALANFLLIAILAWQVYRGIAKREGIPLLLDDDSAAQLTQLLQSLPRKPNSDA
jgi:hypothetical protein